MVRATILQIAGIILCVQTIVHGEAINKIQIKYLRQLAFEVDKEPQHNPLSRPIVVMHW